MGCLTGLGKHIANAVAERGDTLVANARSTDTLQELAERFPDTVRIASHRNARRAREDYLLAMHTHASNATVHKVAGDAKAVHSAIRKLRENAIRNFRRLMRRKLFQPQNFPGFRWGSNMNVQFCQNPHRLGD